MPRKKSKSAEIIPHEPVQSATATTESPASRPAYIDGPPTDEKGKIIRSAETPQGRSMSHGEHGIAAQATDTIASSLRPQWAIGVEEVGKNWGDPYKAIVTTQAFEMGENRRFKQRVFKFKEKPADDVIAALKDNGFTYRASEKAWTITANPDTRKLSDELAAQLRGSSRGMQR